MRSMTCGSGGRAVIAHARHDAAGNDAEQHEDQQHDSEHGRNGLQEATDQEGEHRTVPPLPPSTSSRWRERESACHFAGEVSSTQRSSTFWMGQLGRVQLKALEPRLHRHDRLVVVEEPDRRFLVEQGIGLLQQLGALGGVVGLPGLVDQLVEVGVLEGGVVAGRLRRRRVEAFAARPADPGRSPANR